MEIQKITKTNILKPSSKEKTTAASVTFSEMVAKNEENFMHERFHQLTQQIEEQGKKLLESRSIEDLRKYKQLVKSLLNDVVKHGLQLSEQRGFNWMGRQRIFKIVKEVDTKLLELTNKTLQNEQEGVDLLTAIGEIQGLIINIYT
ncbi:YaaR family protein [Anoxybacteroides amylolyticum]|uniref:DUF327 family protein n=1 Tax=Anoxybacteroides amylolyticum TaxID=294699 RepID=A0A161HTV6_9BACL|nr:YaaR family protein [Anoxybacillus amylolyticus]ANB59474.1 hypothetical protein GFC30_504 [Anoxybacillus amylolyticus]